MTRTFKQVQKQVDQRVRHSRPRGNIHQMMNTVLTYLFEVRKFHVEHWGTPVGEDTIPADVMAMLVAGEQFESEVKEWLAGEARV